MLSKKRQYLFVILVVLLVLFGSSLTEISNGNYLKAAITFILSAFVGYLYYQEVESSK